jgi:two-component sensor histidine kinase
MMENPTHSDQPALGAMAASFFDASEDCVKVIGLDGRLLAMNLNGVCLLEIDDFEQFRGLPWVDLWPGPVRQTVLDAMGVALAGKGVNFAADCPTAKGTAKSWDVAVWPVLDKAGAPIQLISISRDVTEQRRTDEERALSTRELAHRIKNMFAVVDGVISLSARAAVESKSFADALRGRIYDLGRAIAYVAPSEAIAGETSESRTLQGLLHLLLGPYGDLEGPNRRIRIVGDDVPVGSSSTTSLALILNELATNAMKYGALGDRGGRIDIALTIEADVLNVSWVETVEIDPSITQGIDHMGFGSVLLEKAVGRQLGGQYRREWAPEGITITMHFSIARLSR